MTTPGTLYITGTPIGNLEDMTYRAVRTLKEVDLIAAEDTRVTQILLQRYEIPTPLVSYHAHSSGQRQAELVVLLQQGKSIALVCDAGMPGFSDPGVLLIAACHEAGLPVTIVPGPTASSAALAASGFSAKEFTFLGFLPAKAGPRKAVLTRVSTYPGVLMCYEAPHRIMELLTDAREVLGDRFCVCARELTKKFEELARGMLSELIAHFTAQPPRGEFTILFEGALGKPTGDLDAAVKEVQVLVEAGLSRRRAVDHVAAHRGVSRNALYRAAVAEDAP
jgi:16S rRNA (cytidine1402-2'-O)-methyltransferase